MGCGGIGVVVVDGEVLCRSREERAGGWEVVGVVIGGCLVVDLGEGGDVVLGGGE